jgi:queuine/archaeosine tRNA-ribosyltransferase
MELQADFGVDIAMVLDVCPPFPAERAEVECACRLSADGAVGFAHAADHERGVGVHRRLRSARAGAGILGSRPFHHRAP